MREKWKVALWGILAGADVLEDYETFVTAEVYVVGTRRRRLSNVRRLDHDELSIEVHSSVHKLRLGLRRDTSAFTDGYKEVHWSSDEGYEVHRSGVPQCLYAGRALTSDDREAAAARASICGDRLRASIAAPNTTLQVAYAETLKSYVVLDARHLRRDDSSFMSMSQPLEPRRHRRRRRRHHRRRRSLQQATTPEDVSCESQPDKVVELLLLNDVSRWSELGVEVGSNSIDIFATLVDIWWPTGVFGTSADGFGIYDPGVFDCRIQPKLIGQVTFKTNPNDIHYVEGTACATQACRPMITDQCADTEIDGPCLLESTASYAEKNRAALEYVFENSFDTTFLFSHRDFAGPTLGSAFKGAMCDLPESAAIIQVRGSSSDTTGRIAAHELGHCFDMWHDDDGPNLMHSINMGPAAGDNVKFSNKSKAEARAWMANQYFGYGPCLENDPILTEDVCGDGILQDDFEECDVGIIEDHPCCGGPQSIDFACHLLPGCECANEGENSCCSNGRILPKGTMCRPRQHPSCDENERCDGISPECPVDLYASPGTDCENLFDDDGFPGPSPGLCFKGDCKSPDDECLLETSGDFAFACETENWDCTQIRCTADPTRQNNCNNYTHEVANGVPCSAADIPDGQCLTNGEGSSQCFRFVALKKYYWDERICRCRDEAGNIIDDELTFCEGFDRVCRSVAPTTSPAPTVTPGPTFLPTTYAPTIHLPTS